MRRGTCTCESAAITLCLVVMFGLFLMAMFRG
jgi:hypothetical protein